MTIPREIIIQSRSNVSGLFDETILNPKGDWRGPANVSKVADESDWANTFEKTTSSLLLERSLNPSSERTTQIDLTLAQLHDLSSMHPDDRKFVLNGLRKNDKVFETLEIDRASVHEAARAGYVPALVDYQGRVIKQVDKLDATALGFEAQAIKSVLQDTKDPSIKNRLDQDLEDKRWQMAAPFVERARLASFLKQHKVAYRAEQALEDTVAQDIPMEALNSPTLRALRDDARKQLEQYRVENNLVATYNKHLPTLDLDKDGKVSLDELKNRGQSSDVNLNTFVSFLERNYKYLDRKQVGAITIGDIAEFAQERRREINDTRFE